MSSRQSRLFNILKDSFHPEHLEIEDESHQHSGPRSETHYKVLIVSEVFEGRSRLDRQRMINQVLHTEFSSGLHALTQKVLTPSEWAKEQGNMKFESPPCLGGSKKPNQ